MNTYCLLDKLFQSFPQHDHELLPTDIHWHGSSEVINVEVNDNSPNLLHLFETEDSMVSCIDAKYASILLIFCWHCNT